VRRRNREMDVVSARENIAISVGVNCITAPYVVIKMQPLGVLKHHL
jgi:hypothetical protein